MAMMQKRSADDEASNTVRNSAKIDGDVNTVASSICTSSSSYDTTENLTDTDTSSQNKPNNPSRRKNNNSSNASKNSSVESSDDGTRVRFGMKAITTREVESHQNFTAKERSKYWWSDREKDRMMAKHERLVAKYEQQRSPTKPGTLKKSSSASSKIGSYRGLESWTAAGSLKLDYTIEQCISAVMDEQDRQWNDNDDDSAIIAKMSLAVTEDSARRARLNGLQDAQEALKVRGESWCLKGGSDEISVGSAISTGTAAIAKKKKRSKLLARLDDSHKLPKSYDGTDKVDVLASFKKNSSKKDKKKKKKSTPTTSKPKKKKSKDKSSIGGSFDSADLDQATNSKRTIATEPSTIASIISGYGKPPLGASSTLAIAVGDVASFSSEPSMPISPLTTGADEYPLLSTLRRQQEQLRQSSGGSHDGTKSSISSNQHHQQQEPSEMEGEDLLTTLRRQQKKQALEWQNQQHQQDDPSDAGSTSTTPNSGSFSCEPAESTSDPPGRRPRRLASRHGASRSAHQIVGANRAIPENSIVDDSSTTSSKMRRSRSKSRDRTKQKGAGDSTTTPLLQEQPDSSWIDPSKTSIPDSGGLKSIKSLRDGAKTFFKNVSKK